MDSPAALIAGAGPTGLVLACELAWRGLSLRIVDQNRGPSQHSKALGVLPRTLELLESQGVTQEMLRRGHRMQCANFYAGDRQIARFDMTRLESAHAYVLILPQSETEQILIDRLRQLGVEVEWQTTVVDVQASDDAAQAVLEDANGERETVTVPWLVGCDGASSFVRQALNFSFEGEKYSEAFNLADLFIDWALPSREAHVFFSSEGIFFAIPLPTEGQYRLIVNEAPGSAAEDRPDPTVEEFREWMGRRVEHPAARQATLSHPQWRSRFKIHRRRVETLRRGPVLLAGDAAHIHSPAGAQGMNSGIQDAINLGWKLALVIQEKAAPTLIDSYSEERLPVANMILLGTHWLTNVMTLHNPLLHRMRVRVASLMLNQAPVQRRLLHVGSGFNVHYRDSSLVTANGRSLQGKLRKWLTPQDALAAGDRAPDHPLGRPGAGRRLYDLFAHPGHTLLLFASGEEATALCEKIKLRFGDDIQSVTVGDADDPEGSLRSHYRSDRFPVYLIRPDRYIAFRGETLDTEPLLRHLEQTFRTL
jgi:2-polyprenyl-6-methoxyphenol hydroxylase-like FAD-dependent oxidoreductase